MITIFRSLLSLFFPQLCIVCHEKLEESEQHICTDCLVLLPKTNYHLQSDNRLEHFLAGRIPFQRAAAFGYFVKGGSIQHIIHELKYNNNADVGYMLGRLCGRTLKDSDFIKSIDLLVPVPLHRKREKERGYNQSLEICKGISVETGIHIDNETLVRTKNNLSQTKSSRLERWVNVEGIFELTSKDTFHGKHILLVDDVITTGSTIEACIQEIIKAKDVKISIYAIGVAS